jgi:hypothetical protein
MPLLLAEEFSHLEACLNQKIWMTPVASLNDPFEGISKFEPFNPETLERGNEHYNFIRSIFPEQSETDFEKMISSNEFKETLKTVNQTIKNVFTDHGVYSLTSSASNIPMWAHYGNYHQGCCLIFEIDFSSVLNDFIEDNSKEYLTSILDGKEIIPFHSNLPDDEQFKFSFLKIRYLPKPEAILLQDVMQLKDECLNTKYILQRSLGVKFLQWNYESEYRLIANQNSANGGLLDLRRYAPFLKISGVILGKNNKNKTIFMALCEKLNADLYQAECSNEEYKIAFEKILDNKLTDINNPKYNLAIQQ